MSLEDKEAIMAKLEEINRRMEEIRIAEYIELVHFPHKMFWINFFVGLARGFGAAIGTTFLGAIFLIFLYRIAQIQIPVIAEFVARIIKIVETYL